MIATNDFPAVFAAQTRIMRPFSDKLVCTRDDDSEYYLNTTHIMKNKKPLFFGAVQIRKNYVAYHLMPVYVFPELLKGMSPALKQRMQGKSCFNFTSVDVELFEELGTLTKAGFEAYKNAGYIGEHS
ncbi:MAG: hypothetical protein ACR2QU_11610 [Gammaproteobacteria bacterium]